MRKSVLIIGNYPPPDGGVPRHIEYLAPGLADLGWDVHVLPGGKYGVNYRGRFSVHKEIRDENCRLTARNHLLLSRPRYWFLLRRLRKEEPALWARYMDQVTLGLQIAVANEVTVISAYNLYLGAPVGAMLSQICGVPLVVNNFGEIFTQGDFFRRHRWLLRFVFRQVSTFVSMTRHCGASYGLLGLSPKIVTVEYGIDIKAFHPANDGSTSRKALGATRDDAIVLFVGRMDDEMGLHVLLQATSEILANTSNVKVVIVGRTGPLTVDANRLASNNVGRVFVKPDLSLEELPSYYAAATMLVAPTQSDRACGSLAAAEAMASGKPVVATNVGGIPEIVVHGHTGLLVKPEDPKAVVDAIRQLLNNPGLMVSMGQCGRQRAEMHFDKDKTNRRMAEVLEQAITGR